MTTTYGPAGEATQHNVPDVPASFIVNGYLYMPRGPDHWTSRPDPAAKGNSGLNPSQVPGTFDAAAAGRVMDLGSQTVDGTATTEYSALISPIKLFGLGPARSANLTSVTGPLLGGEYEHLIPVRIWVDRQGRARKLTATAPTAVRGQSTSSATVTYSDFGMSVSPLVAPPASEVTVAVVPKPSLATGTVFLRSPSGRETVEAGVALLTFGNGYLTRFGGFDRPVLVGANGQYSLSDPPPTATRVYATFYAHAVSPLSCAPSPSVSFVAGSTTSNVNIVCRAGASTGGALGLTSPDRQLIGYTQVFAVGADASTHAPDHPADLAVDGDPATSWQSQPSTTTHGAGQLITVHFAHSTNVSYIGILSGAGSNPQTFLEESRPKEVRVSFSDGQQLIETLQDVNTFQKMNIQAADVTSMTLKILSVYPSPVGNSVAISEIELFQRS